MSDGYSVITTEEKTVNNTDSEMSQGLNLKNGDVITDKQQIIANGSQLLIDGTDYSSKAQKSISGSGKMLLKLQTRMYSSKTQWQ